MNTATKNSELHFIDWLDAHERQLRKYRGKWLAIHPAHGIVAVGTTLSAVRQKFLRAYPAETPLFHKVPRENEPTYVL